jgi:pimeloyl-ACP methyl ester carboxylesterase
VKRPGRTAPSRARGGGILPGSIAEIGFRRLGGLDQWVLIRGVSIANPVLVMLHGGPGFSETALFRRFAAPLEKDFTLVYWDQRGSGKSFAKDIPRSTMTVAQFVADLDELIDAVRKRVGHEKVTIFGHSWGSVLGVLYAARSPEKVAAYVGSGQIGDWPAAEAASYAYAVAAAERRHNAKATNALRRIGPPPYDSHALWTQRLWLQRLEGQLGPARLMSFASMFLRSPELSLRDLAGLFRAFRFSLDAMWPEVSTLNLIERAPSLRMPVFFFLGQNDHWVPPATSIAYFEALTAPAKTLRLFERSGHEPFADEPDRFNRAMVEFVRPAVT